MLTPGIKGKQTVTVTHEQTAAHYGSGALEVFATPAMIALLEETAWKSVQPYVGAGLGTVGTRVDVRHLAATPLGMQVTCESELIEIDRRRLVFKVDVFDESGKIGEGTHERFVIQNDKFFAAANAKKPQEGEH